MAAAIVEAFINETSQGKMKEHMEKNKANLTKNLQLKDPLMVTGNSNLLVNTLDNVKAVKSNFPITTVRKVEHSKWTYLGITRNQGNRPFF